MVVLDGGCGGGGGRCGYFEFARSTAGQVPTSDKLGVVDHPVRAKVVFVSNETLVQRQIGADGVLLHDIVFVLFCSFNF